MLIWKKQLLTGKSNTWTQADTLRMIFMPSLIKQDKKKNLIIIELPSHLFLYLPLHISFIRLYTLFDELP